MRFYYLVFVTTLNLFFVSCKSQQGQIDVKSVVKENLEIQLNQLTESFIKSDYATLLKFTYPKLVEKAGGTDKAIEGIKKEIENLKNNGIVFKSIITGSPTLFVEAGDEIHTLIPQTATLNVIDGTLRSESSLIAISKDGGKTWYFIDTAYIDMTNVKETLPNYNDKLKIPESKEPVFSRSN